MSKKSVLVCRFAYGFCEHPDTVTWMMDQLLWLERNGYQPMSTAINDTPITMTRNRALKIVLEKKIDYLLMVDSDMKPDMYLGIDPEAKPFLPTALEFMKEHAGPCAIAAPYCGPPPVENVYVFRWENNESENPSQDLKLDQYSRGHASLMRGIKRAAALPTGVFLIGRDALELLPKDRAHFYYEWKNNSTEKGSTEDVTFSRDLQHLGVKTYCHWDAWAGHWKMKCVGKPIPYTEEFVEQKLHEAVRARRGAGDRLVDVKDGVVTPQ